MSRKKNRYLVLTKEGKVVGQHSTVDSAMGQVNDLEAKKESK